MLRPNKPFFLPFRNSQPSLYINILCITTNRYRRVFFGLSFIYTYSVGTGIITVHGFKYREIFFPFLTIFFFFYVCPVIHRAMLRYSIHAKSKLFTVPLDPSLLPSRLATAVRKWFELRIILEEKKTNLESAKLNGIFDKVRKNMENNETFRRLLDIIYHRCWKEDRNFIINQYIVLIWYFVFIIELYMFMRTVGLP